MSKELIVKWDEQAVVVSAILDGMRIENMDSDAVSLAAAYGLIERHEQTKACPSCGTPKFDFGYWKVTPAGRLLADALKAQGAQQ